ncbi:hypothetical protein RN001_000292 [Aquatica leii]|uniref:NADH:ubiquinone oxidoreductase intermediate-associated protein 30 domain-containing protein n=1 Tax=Aquatica leii TaxID=1421715 RepID=A0AAN7PJX1_9COLE|nr:hypothetical protein RN001_000292 [Aquatica leii]
MNLIIKQRLFSVHRVKSNLQQILGFKTSCALNLFYERDDKGGYSDNRKYPSKIQMIRDGLKELKQEIALWSEEMKESFESDPCLEFRQGETDVAWRFESEKSLEKWVVTSDSDHNEGFSKCSLTLSKHGKGLFSGVLNTELPKDGRIKRAGYCNMKSMRARKSFKRDTHLDWTPYNILVLKVKGDGRSYMLNISTKGFFDITWNDTFNYVLYTRGGPYWQVSKIPFSKFIFSSKGRVQDKQFAIPLNRIASFGISAGDKINGPFSLEIDYIGLEFNPNHVEEFAYEMYETDRYIAGS